MRLYIIPEYQSEFDYCVFLNLHIDMHQKLNVDLVMLTNFCVKTPYSILTLQQEYFLVIKKFQKGHTNHNAKSKSSSSSW